MGIRIGVVGLGKMGLLHASLLNAQSNVQVVAMCEKRSIIRRFAKRLLPGTKIVSDVGDMAELGLDAVYVTTPPGAHFPIVRAVYTHGIARNVFVEKPLTASYQEAEELCRLVHQHGGVNMVGYHKRFGVTFRKARDLLAQGELGAIASFKGYARSSDFVGAKEGVVQVAARGGVLRDSGCHAIDLLLWWFGALEVVSAESSSALSVFARVRTPEGVSGELHASSCEAGYRLPEIGVEVMGSKGRMKVNEDKVELTPAEGKSVIWHRHDLNDQVAFLLADPEYFREDEAFVRAVLDGADAMPDFQAASRVEEVMDCIQRGLNGHG